MTGSRLAAWSSPMAFAVLCATLGSVGRISVIEAIWAAAAVVLAFAPTGWWAPAGWRRRAAEATLALPAWALVMVADPVQRRVLLPPLLAAAAWSAVASAWPRVPIRRRTALLVLLALSARAATGMALVGWPWWRVGIALIACGVAGGAAVRLGGRDLGVVAALLAAAVPVDVLPVVGVVSVVVALVAGRPEEPQSTGHRYLRWLPGLAGAGLVAMALAPWGGLGPQSLFPELGVWSALGALGALAVTRWLPPGAAGAVWLLVAFTVGPALAPSPDRRGFTLGGDLADVELPAGTGAPYVLDIGLDGVGALTPGTVVAWFRVGDHVHRVLSLSHAIPRDRAVSDVPRVIRRPVGVGRQGGWRTAVRSIFEVPAGVVPRLTRHPGLPDGVTVVVETEGTARPTPPRDRDLAWWVVVAAVVVAVLQLLSGTWRWEFAAVPWTILVVGGLTARAWVEPLRLLGERHAPDLALAALLTAWLPAAVLWLRRARTARAVAALLLPLALATPHLTPPLYGDEPFHLAVMASMAGDRDVDLADDIDPQRHPEEAVFEQDHRLLHSPALGVLLLPGFVLAGRTGALVLLALAGALAVSLIARRARRLGVPGNRLSWVVLVLAVTYPLAVFATQIWVELPGALAVAAILSAVAGGRGGRWAAILWALVAASIKTRLALLTFPPVLVGWWLRRRGRVVGVAVVALAAVASLGVGWLTMGHPFGIYRRLHDLLPADSALVLRVIGGLAFDPAGGLLFSAPLWLIALAGVAALWRRGGPGERALLVGCAATVAALLHSLEWYGGGSPPARYLVPMLPAFALAGGLLLREPRRWRRAAELLLLPSVAVWWVLVSRPHLSVNPGDGGWWATDALARSYLADTDWLVPSFLVPRTATWVVPVVVVVVMVFVWSVAHLRPFFARRLAAAATAVWLLGAAGLVAVIELRADRVVEAEAPQVRRHGGSPHPPEGTFSRFTHRSGWRLGDGDDVTFPLNLPDGAEVWLEGWLVGRAQHGAEVEMRWDDGRPTRVRVAGRSEHGRLRVSPPPGAGRHRLHVAVRTGPDGAAVLDRVVVRAP